eukprot:3038466-Pyramimonas_sp.AAC.1
MGKYDDALPLYEQSLTIDEKVYGKEHPEVARSLSSLAGMYKKMGKYVDALPLNERSLAIREKVHHEEEHPDVARSLNNL